MYSYFIPRVGGISIIVSPVLWFLLDCQRMKSNAHVRAFGIGNIGNSDCILFFDFHWFVCFFLSHLGKSFHLGSSEVSVGKTRHCMWCFISQLGSKHSMHKSALNEWWMPSIFWPWGHNEDLDINWRELEIVVHWVDHTGLQMTLCARICKCYHDLWLSVEGPLKSILRQSNR